MVTGSADTSGDAQADAGVALDTMSVSGSGESSPLDDNRTLAGRARNRRVEIVVERAL
nr:hypothetical protein [Paraburkholderia sp. J41]